MELEKLNIRTLIKHKLTASQYVILFLLYSKEYTILNAYFTSTDYQYYDMDLNNLIAEGYVITSINHLDFDLYQLTPKAIKLFYKDTSKWFDELLLEFPTRATRPDGMTVALRISLPASKKRYDKAIGKDEDLHRSIIKALKYEVSQRTRSNGLMYMKTLPRWIESREWESFLELSNDDSMSSPDELLYGQQLV